MGKGDFLNKVPYCYKKNHDILNVCTETMQFSSMLYGSVISTWLYFPCVYSLAFYFADKQVALVALDREIMVWNRLRSSLWIIYTTIIY